jgi:hypothetical protein
MVLSNVGGSLLHAFFERRLIIAVFDLIERRRLEGEWAGVGEWVGLGERGSGDEAEGDRHSFHTD